MTGRKVALPISLFPQYNQQHILYPAGPDRPTGYQNHPFFDILTQRIIAKEPLRYRP